MLRPEISDGRSFTEESIRTDKGAREKIKKLSEDLLSGGSSQDVADALAQIEGAKPFRVLMQIAKGKSRRGISSVACRALRLRPEREASAIYYRHVLNSISCPTYVSEGRSHGDPPSGVSEAEILELGNRTDQASLQLLKDIISCKKKITEERRDGSPFSLNLIHYYADLPRTRRAAFQALHARLDPGDFAEFAKQIASLPQDREYDRMFLQKREALRALAEFLADIPGTEAFEIAKYLIKSHNDSLDFYARDALVRILGEIKNPESVELLALLLDYDYPALRDGEGGPGYTIHGDSASRVLQELHEPEATLLIGRALRTVRHTATARRVGVQVEKLAMQYCDILAERQDGYVIDAWKSAFESEDDKVVARAIGALSEIGGSEYVELFERGLHRNSRDFVIRDAACAALRKLGDQVFEVWDRALDSEDRGIHTYALAYFKSCQQARVVESLGKALEHPNSSVRMEAVIALGNRNEGTAIQLLKRKAELGDACPYVCMELARVLTQHHQFDSSASLLSREMAKWEVSFRASAIRTLAGNTDSKAISLLEYALSDDEPYVRLGAIEVLSALRTPDSKNLLREKFRQGDQDLTVCLALLESLGTDQGISVVLPIASRALVEGNRNQRIAAISILATRREPEALELIKTRARQGDQDPEVLAALARALAEKI